MKSHKPSVSSIHDPEYHTIIDALIGLRETAKLSQKAIAQAIGLTQPDISKIERRERRIDILEALRWVRATGSDPGEFFAQLGKLER
ncbi:helix-turn-helix transcriptional regulator [Desertifilum sp. FACHB-1129]|uniref:Helix-turn-helix domain-containing protein n=1 Tax=Desertifilum tharense IPPAS B-1220 TaxID=1781255 RepID=A0ACD5H1J2_9CYAN|nr:MULTISPECIES: helix-turn-helix transcriptional regulator [Desertifilum]MCD8488788.1 helix-turn-helix transcriptional regulator [Desertifilum sp.]MDA0211821.1 helix-turn-helix transcriptional regulator [Cyanobacteria bacterium FC1]MDI9635821.1 helix-turn-helix transcriptional regulator [Geitlerinema splendidum]MDL5047415.1 helix-turn-helix transcriptional regulator [Oscillatoria amoena NRMC-F 0135]MBD2312050.1 helix-turn-helix transcriptional regulator [Desertifilum sp. FACHB-1129]